MMTEETPGKILGLLGASLASMAFLLMVTATNASFQGSPVSVPDPFGSQNVVAIIDSTAHGYSNFLSANLFQSIQNDIGVFAYNANWVIDNSDNSIVAMLGLQTLANPYGVTPVGTSPTVAGAYTSDPSATLASSETAEGFSLNSIYRMLIR